MNLELTDEQAAAFRKELNDIIDGTLFLVAAHSNPEGNPRQGAAGAGW
jgi:hypothetical protein